jgi:hypothetical protein
MDHNKLLSCHQVALIEMMQAPSRAAQSWAADRADYYADRIAALREQLALPVKPFDFRQQMAPKPA